MRIPRDNRAGQYECTKHVMIRSHHGSGTPSAASPPSGCNLSRLLQCCPPRRLEQLLPHRPAPGYLRSVRSPWAPGPDLGLGESETLPAGTQSPQRPRAAPVWASLPSTHDQRLLTYTYSVSKVPRSVLKCETVLAPLMRPQKFLDTPV